MKTHSKTLNTSILISAGCLFILTLSAKPTQDIQKEIQRQNLRITKLLQPTAKQKIARASKEYENRVLSSNWRVGYHDAAVDAVRSQFGNLPTQDIDVLVQLVMFELWESEEEALKEMLDEMHRMNQAKKKQREYINHLKEQKASAQSKMRKESKVLLEQPPTTSVQKKPRPVRKSPKMASTRRLRIKYPKTPNIIHKNTRDMNLAEMDKYMEEMEHKMDTLGGLSEELSLKLQILMDRRAKIIQTLSNILKKISQTSDTLISNIKE
jgi:hypothetical protein